MVCSKINNFGHPLYFAKNHHQLLSEHTLIFKKLQQYSQKHKQFFFLFQLKK